MKYSAILESVGLSKAASRLYVESLKLGPASAIQLAQKLGITRQSVYELLPLLQERGLVKQINVNNKRLFQAVDPTILQAIAEESMQRIKEIIPSLKNIQANNNAVPLVSIYENPLAMREWYEDFIKSAGKGDTMLIWSSGLSWYQLDQAFYDRFMKFKDKNQVEDRIIAPDTPEGHLIAQKVAAPNRHYRFDPNWWRTDAEMWVWNDQIVYLTVKENATNMIVIQSEALAAIERYNFRKAWDQLKSR